MMRKVLTFIMAGGKGERLWPLTRDRTKPAVPFGGIYRIIDFSLSNCLNSGLRRIYVLTQYKSASLEKHIRLGWNILSPELGEYIEVLPAQQRIGDVWYRGTADAIYQNIYVIKMEEPDEVLVLAGDHIYKMNYYHMIDFHREVNADLTLAVIRMQKKNVSHFGVVEFDSSGKITDFQEKPNLQNKQEKTEIYASMGIYVFKKSILMEVLEEDSTIGDSRFDFGRDIIPKMLSNNFRIYAFNFFDENRKEAKYWRDIGTIDAYYEANMDLVALSPPFNLYDKDWSIHTYQEQFPPARTVFAKDGETSKVGLVLNSLVSGGCILSGKRLESSVLSYNVELGSGSEVYDSILMEGVNVGKNAKIKRAIIDKDVTISPGMVIGYDPADNKKHLFVTDSGIVVVAKKEKVG